MNAIVSNRNPADWIRAMRLIEAEGERVNARVSRLPIFSTRFATLCAKNMHAYLCGRHAAAREHWLREARFGNPELKRTHVSFARNSHHAFLYSLRRALEDI